MADDEKKPPATSGTKRKDPSNTVIWDTVSDLRDYPLLCVAIELAKENFQFCVSQAFKIVDKEKTKDHLKVVLGLKGAFQVDKNNVEPGSYATSGLSHKDRNPGIFFNQKLANRSNEETRRKAVNEMLNDINVIGLIAVLQQVVEHEIGHVKYHFVGIDDPTYDFETPSKQDKGHKEYTPTDKSLDGEAGYAVQREIRHQFFGESRHEPTTVGINEHAPGPYQFEGAYSFQLCRIKEDREGKLTTCVGHDWKPMTIEDIIKHMDYPKRSDRCSRPDYTVDPPTGDGGGRGEGHGGGGGGGRGGGGRRGGGGGDNHRQRKWMDSIKSKLEAAMADAEKIWNPPEFNFRSNPDSPTFDQKIVPYDFDEDLDAYNANVAGVLACEIKIIPCDKDWNENEKFTPDQEIFAKIEIKNVTQEERVLVQVCLGPSFGKYGIQLEFIDVMRGHCRGGNSHCAIPIEPGERYTIWRRFTSGNDPSVSCAYRTPQTPGMYSLRVKYGNKYHENLKLIEIVDDAENPAQG